jgi:hypothetical protein
VSQFCAVDVLCDTEAMYRTQHIYSTKRVADTGSASLAARICAVLSQHVGLGYTIVIVAPIHELAIFSG